MFEIGSSLREARLRQAIDLVDAEQSTKIRSKYLRALEDERFELLPAQTYIKGFLRSYADYLGLDGQLYVDEYNSRYVKGEDDLPVRTRRSATSRTHRRVEASAVLFALAGIAAAAALVVVAWRFGGSEPQRVTNLGPRPVAETAQAPTRRSRAPRPSSGRWVAVDLKAARGPTSLAVYRLFGKNRRLLFTGTLEQGKRKSFAGPRLWLDVSNPENIVLRLNKVRQRVRTAEPGPAVLVATRSGIRNVKT